MAMPSIGIGALKGKAVDSSALMPLIRAHKSSQSMEIRLSNYGRVMMGWTIESCMSPEWRNCTDELVSDAWFESLSDFISDEVKQCFGRHTPHTLEELR
jgi:hypothetical protein